MTGGPRTILHVDMDAFYASVEERERPELAGRAVVVGGSPEGRGVVAAANYAAREYGVRSAMPAARARQLCPHAVFLRSRMALYAEVSAEIRALFHRYTPLVEPLSLDEAFLDVSASRELFGEGAAIAARIKREIRSELGLVASVGVAPNKFLAKLASDFDKPDGLVAVPAEEVQAFLDPLPVERLRGVGAAARDTLHALGIHRIADLRSRPEALLRERLGKWGLRLFALAHGRDEGPVTPEQEARSISHETTFEVDVAHAALLRAWLRDLCEQVARRLRRQGLRAHAVEVKVRYADFRTVTRSAALAAATANTPTLWRRAAGLLDALLARRADPIRLLGMGANRLTREHREQGDLFEAPRTGREERIDTMVDAVHERFGHAGLRRGPPPGR